MLEIDKSKIKTKNIDINLNNKAILVTIDELLTVLEYAPLCQFEKEHVALAVAAIVKIMP